MEGVPMSLLIPLLIQFAAVDQGAGDSKLLPVDDLHAFVMDPSVELSCTAPAADDGTMVDILSLEIRYSTDGEILSDAEVNLIDKALESSPIRRSAISYPHPVPTPEGKTTTKHSRFCNSSRKTCYYPA